MPKYSGPEGLYTLKRKLSRQKDRVAILSSGEENIAKKAEERGISSEEYKKLLRGNYQNNPRISELKKSIAEIESKPKKPFRGKWTDLSNMPKKKGPKLLTHIKKTPQQYNLFKGGTIDLEAQKKAGVKITPQFRRKGIVEYTNTPSITPTPSKNTKKAIWIQGAKDIEDVQAVRKTLDKIYDEALKTYKPEALQVWYGGHELNDTDLEIEKWAKSRGIETRPISPFDKELFPKKGDWQDKLKEREDALVSLEEKGPKGGKEGRQLLNRHYLDPKGVERYSYQDRQHWYNRYKELSAKFGKGKTSKIVQAYLDEVEDELRGVSRQTASKSQTISKKGLGVPYNKVWLKPVQVSSLPQLDEGQTRQSIKQPNPKSALAAIEVLEERNVWHRENAEAFNQMLIDKGHFDPSGTPEAIEFNAQQAAQVEVAPGYPAKPKEVRDLYSESAKERMAHFKGDIAHPLKTFESIITDYPDSPGKEGGTQYIEEERVGDHIGKKEQYGKDPDFIVTKKGEIKKNLNIVNLNKPKTKSKPIIKIITDLINTQINDLGYSNKNVFGDFFDSDRKKEEKKQLYEGKEGTRGTHTEKPELEEIKIEDAENIKQEAIKERIEKRKIEEVGARNVKAKLFGNYLWDKGKFAQRTEKSIITEYLAIPDKDAPELISQLDTSHTTDADKKKTGGKVIGAKERKFPSNAQIREALPEKIKEERKWLYDEAKKHPQILKDSGTHIKAPWQAKTRRKIIGESPSEIKDGKVKAIGAITGFDKIEKKNKLLTGGIIRHGAVREVIRHPADESFPYTDHRPEAQNRYVRVPYSGEKISPHIKPGARGILSRAYVSEPSMATTSDIRKELQKSSAPNKRVLPKGISEIIKTKKQATGTGVPEGEVIKMTQSRRTGKWSTPSELRKETFKALRNKRIKDHIKKRPLSVWGKLGRLSILFPPAMALSSLYSKNAEASLKNISQETIRFLAGSDKVWSGVNATEKGYFQTVGLKTKGIQGGRRPIKPIPGAGGENTPYASIMRFFGPSTKDDWKYRKGRRVGGSLRN